jgi:hypothetical protein
MGTLAGSPGHGDARLDSGDLDGRLATVSIVGHETRFEILNIDGSQRRRQQPHDHERQ